MTVEATANVADSPPEFDVGTGAAAPAPASSNEEGNGGTRQAGTDDSPKDVRTLLAGAMKRGPDGKFVGKDGEEVIEPAPVAATPQPSTASQQQQHSRLTAEDQAAISSLPEANRAAVQALLEARGTALAQSAQYVQQLSEQVRGYGNIEQLIGPRRQAWAMQGVAPEQALNQLLALSDFAGRDPGEFVRWFAGQHGLDLLDLGQDHTPPDPQFVALQREIAELKGAMGQQTSQQKQQMHTVIMGEIAQFAREAGADGTPARPYFDAVAEDMLHLMPGIMAQNGGLSRRDALQIAYERAVWANPTTRAHLQSTQQAQERATAAAAAANARKKGRSITGSAPAGEQSSTAMAAGKTVRGALEAAIAQHS